MKRITTAAILALCLGLAGPQARAFCGFYVAKADTKLFNKASQVAIVRHDDKTVLTMANDFQGDLEEFAMVIPVPTFITREQIHVGERALLEHLDAYSAPRLVEYFDPDPCLRLVREKMAMPQSVGYDEEDRRRDEGLGITVEAAYTVGEYDIVILSATQSHGLETWLRQNGYRLPEGAARVLGSYIKQDMRFFVAKVNLEEQSKTGFQYLRPLQVAYESPKFMLPIRLGMLNADGQQELFVYLLTRRGRVETTNYRTVRLSTGMDLPLFVKSDFGNFYRDMFARSTKKENDRAVFLEYAWNMSWCDPCAADPLSREELTQLGVFWLDRRNSRGQAQEVFLTRLHLRYDAEHFPEDLVFQETGDNANFQARFVLRHPWNGSERCPGAEAYRRGLRDRWEREAGTLASLTGWDINDIRERMRSGGQSIPENDPWWKRIWKR